MQKILIIEDDLSVRQSTKELLEFVGYNVKVANNGIKGINTAVKFLPDVIICDISMPVMDGYAVLNELAKNSKTSAIPFIFLTAKAEPADFKYGMHLGADDYITKPFSSGDLLKSIETRLKKKEKIIKSVKNLNRKDSLKEKKTKTPDKDSQIIIMSGSKPQNLKIGTIVCIMALQKYSTVFTSEGKKIIANKLLKDWEIYLPENQFLRIHRGTIINLDFVKKFEKWNSGAYRVYLEKFDEPLMISRRYSSKIRNEKGF